MRVDYYKGFPAGTEAMVGLQRAVRSGGLEPGLVELVKIRASQINGCTPRERAALAWCEALTDLPRTGAPDEDYAAVEKEFTPAEIAALTFAIVAINGWNRLAVGLRSDVLTLDGLDLRETPAPQAVPGTATGR